MRIINITTTVLTALAVTMVTAPAYAAPVCIDITATVALVSERGDHLRGAIKKDDVITGRYVYESTTSDTNSATTVGDYRHTATPFGITLNAGGYVFRTDPSKVNFLVELVNNHGNPQSDNYLLRSYNNIFGISVPSAPRSETRNHIAWQLDDQTLNALSSSEVLPTTPPALTQWTSFFGLTITSRNPRRGEDFFIRAHVTEAKICPST